MLATRSLEHDGNTTTDNILQTLFEWNHMNSKLFILISIYGDESGVVYINT